MLKDGIEHCEYDGEYSVTQYKYPLKSCEMVSVRQSMAIEWSEMQKCSHMRQRQYRKRDTQESSQ